ncbi:EKC/KEOPS complex subunit Lage3 [Camelus dromedarius]|uniref:L antigen family member 3 n=1 Tax=Camelus dromedarius TaxID=9838 RepID=A0A5N4C2S8_CAMDR|nr:EKC/KEOPS complex subunit LAGE3-like isoform X1 [Camelus dromedarius]KAB1253179.1 EKC/KEOPS complex subunit Lage3 [Camelus dromedarius]
MQAPHDGAGGAAGGAGTPSGPGGPTGHGGWDGAGEEGAAAAGAPQVEGASLAAAQGEEASALSGAPGSPMLEFTLMVPFLSCMDAEVARRYLTPGAEPYLGDVQRELTVIGSDLVIRLTAEDSGILQISVASLLNRLSIVVQTMQHFVPPFFAKTQPGKGG